VSAGVSSSSSTRSATTHEVRSTFSDMSKPTAHARPSLRSLRLSRLHAPRHPAGIHTVWASVQIQKFRRLIIACSLSRVSAVLTWLTRYDGCRMTPSDGFTFDQTAGFVHVVARRAAVHRRRMAFRPALLARIELAHVREPLLVVQGALDTFSDFS
jgi:hypothetical protein